MEPAMKKTVAALIAAFGLAVTALPAAAQSGSAVSVADYTVFVDPPTGFAFVKLPAGWKFVGRVASEDVSKLPATVVTWLLPPEEGRTLAAVEGAARR
jgi:hypothetical protein